MPGISATVPQVLEALGNTEAKINKKMWKKIAKPVSFVSCVQHYAHEVTHHRCSIVE